MGAGTMGNGIAQACAVAGINVVMVDIAQAAVDKAQCRQTDRLLQKDKITEADKAWRAPGLASRAWTQYDDLKAAQLVIEAATENHALKNKILAQPDALLAPEVIVATNTSSTHHAAGCRHAAARTALSAWHFFNSSADDGAGRDHSRPADQ
ncbi:MAG: 3-hydroxyacyl-CoA dehydrogenase NAD-binding domain-containing protein [Burkholderiaceae bacterium]